MFNKLFLKVLLSITLTVTALSSANASLISQDVLFQDDQGIWSAVGNISVDTAIANDDGFISEWANFSLFGYDLWTVEQAATQGFGAGVFEAAVNVADFTSGLQFLSFDLTESNSSTYAFNGFFDVMPGDYFIDAFNSNGIALFGGLKLGQAVVTGAEVPEPETVFLLLSGIAALMVRRKKA